MERAIKPKHFTCLRKAFKWQDKFSKFTAEIWHNYKKVFEVGEGNKIKWRTTTGNNLGKIKKYQFA
jgi:hypothetical protein